MPDQTVLGVPRIRGKEKLDISKEKKITCLFISCAEDVVSAWHGLARAIAIGACVATSTAAR